MMEYFSSAHLVLLIRPVIRTIYAVTREYVILCVTYTHSLTHTHTQMENAWIFASVRGRCGHGAKDGVGVKR